MTPPPSSSNEPAARDATRQRLIEDHVEWVRALAGRIKRDIGGSLDFEELVAYGMRGLVEAANRFDASRGVAFTTFSYYRIRGAIFDGLRQLGWLNRSEYARFQAASDALLENQVERARPPGPTTSADEAATELATCIDQVATIFVCSLDEVARDPVDEQSVDAEEAVGQRQLRDQVRHAVQRLPERERQLLEMLYFEELTLEAAGKRLGLSKSWSSRLHARAIAQLSELLPTT